MKILSKYVLKEHVGPLTFALTALTSLMLLNFISRQFGELVGKGLPWAVIAEFLLLSIPFTVALTVPMSVLVAVLYAFSRLAAENEVTALKASGVSPWRLVAPAIGGGVVASLALLAFNDQVLPLANHRLKTLTEDIQQAKPTFALKEQVINPISEGKFYLKAGKIDREGSGGRMKEVVIYDLADPTQRRTIYADSGRINLAPNRRDINLDLFHGEMQEVASDKPGQLNRLFYDHDLIRVRDVARDFQKTDSQTSSKGDREMSVCEMQRRLWQAQGTYVQAEREFDDAKNPKASRERGPEPRSSIPEPRGIGWLYCRALNAFSVQNAHAAVVEPTALHRVPQQGTAARRDTMRRGLLRAAPPPKFTPATPAATATDSARIQQMRRAINAQPDLVDKSLVAARTAEAKMRLDMAKLSRNRYDIEINKKFSLAAACLIFVLLGAPLAVRFPRGGVGLVIGVSLLVFALYYVGLIGGEALANAGLVPPFWAMWGTNSILAAVGVYLLLRMGSDTTSNRGGDWSDRLDAFKARFGRGPQADLTRGTRQ
ncbi:MAG: LptF/LptG family permease [Gemmatimonadota bacterium]|nr:LptF/LptG family permease [Gemmatimonadota bacterium]